MAFFRQCDMERKTIVRSLVALNAVLLCILVWLLVSDKPKASKKPVKQDVVELADSLESSNSSCVDGPGKGAGETVSGSNSGSLR